MATKKTPKESDFALDATGNDADLEQAIDDLRGVLKTDADAGGLDDFAAATSGSSDLTAFGDFGDTASSGSDFSAGNFGGSSFDEVPAPRAQAPRASSQASQEPGSALNSNLDLIMDIPIDVQIVLGTSRMQVSGLMNLSEGATIPLDRKIGEPVEIMVNGRRIARGEITVLEKDNTRFGVKLIEVMSAKKA